MDRGHGQEFRLLLSGRWELSCTSAVSARLGEDKPAAGVVGKKGAGRTQVLKGGAATISALVSLHPLTVTPKYQEPALLSMSAVPSPPTQQPLARWLHFLRCQAAWAGAVRGAGVACHLEDEVPAVPFHRFPPTSTPQGWPAHPMHPNNHAQFPSSTGAPAWWTCSPSRISKLQSGRGGVLLTSPFSCQGETGRSCLQESSLEARSPRPPSSALPDCAPTGSGLAVPCSHSLTSWVSEKWGTQYGPRQCHFSCLPSTPSLSEIPPLSPVA